MTAPRTNPKTVKVDATRVDAETKARTARQEAAENAKKTAQSTSEAVRETAHEVVEDTKSFMSRFNERAGFVAMRTAQEVGKARQKAKPFVRPVAYTALAIADLPLAIGVVAIDQGQKIVRNRVRELGDEPEVTLTAVQVDAQDK